MISSTNSSNYEDFFTYIDRCICLPAVSTVEPPLSGLLLSGHLYYPGTSIVWTAQIGHVACSLLTIMEFGLDKSTRREPKGCCLPVWWLLLRLRDTERLSNKNFIAKLRRALCCCVVYQLVTGSNCWENYSILTGQVQGTRKHT